MSIILFKFITMEKYLKYIPEHLRIQFLKDCGGIQENALFESYRKIFNQDFWLSKRPSVIFVKNQEDKQKLYSLLVAQDDYWEGESKLIRVFSDDYTEYRKIYSVLENCGKLDIYNVDEIRGKVDFIIFQDVYE